MKKIIINDDRRLNKSSIAIGYIEENKTEQIQFDIPEKYKDYGKKACFKADNTTFAKAFDNITDNTLTLTRDITKYKELDMSIEFFKIENEDTIVARTSTLRIAIEDSVICDDIEQTEPKAAILDNLITETIKEYTPTMQYEPDTKKYVGETHHKNFIGYSPSKAQTLKNVNGTLKWIDG